jgi:hypothetical protein
MLTKQLHLIRAGETEVVGPSLENLIKNSDLKKNRTKNLYINLHVCELRLE